MNLPEKATISSATNLMSFILIVVLSVAYALTDKPSDVLEEVREMKRELDIRVTENSKRISALLDAKLAELDELRRLNASLTQYIDEKTEKRYTYDDAKTDWNEVAETDGITKPKRFKK